jgi:hypothetical protein
MHITRSDGSLCTLWTNRCVGRPAQRNMGERSISHSPHTTGARVEEGFKSSGLWPTQISRPSRNVARAAATRRAATQAAAERAAATTRRQRRRCCRRRCCRPNRRRRPGRTRTLRRQLRPKTAAEAETSAPEPPDAHHRSSRTPPDPLPPHTAAGREPSSPRPPLPDPPLPHPRSERRRPSRRRSQRHRLSCRRRRPNCRRPNDRRCPSRTPTDPLPPGLRARCVSLCPLSSRLLRLLRACLQADAKCLSAKYGGM